MARADSVKRAIEQAGGFATAKKNIVLQFGGRERTEAGILGLIRTDLSEKGINDEEIEVVDIYIKPEEEAAFYVVNRSIEGKVRI